jgi:hypothetical protein
MRSDRTYLSSMLISASLALGAIPMTSEIVFAQHPNPRPPRIERPDSIRPGDQIDLIYDARTRPRKSYTFGQIIGMKRSDPNATRPADAIIRDHRKGSDFGKEGSNRYPPAGTGGGPRPTSGNTVRDHRGEPDYPAVTTSTERDHRRGANPNPSTVKSFRTGTGETVTVKSRPGPLCIGNACGFERAVGSAARSVWNALTNW